MLRIIHEGGLAGSWLQLGQALTVNDINDLQALYQDDPSRGLLETMATWLRGNKQLPDPPSWARLIWAIAHPDGGDKKIEGKRAAKRFKGTLACTCVNSLLFLHG